MKLANLPVTFLVGLISQNIFASNFYTGFSIGQSTFPNAENSSVDISIIEDKNSFSFSINGGYSFHEYLAVEIAYNNLGDYSNETQINIPPFAGGPNSTFEYEITGFSLEIIPRYPISDKWSVYAKLGNQWWDGKSTNKAVVYTNGSFDGFEFSEENVSNDDTLIGFGVSHSFSKNIEYKFSIAKYEIANDDVDNYSFSVGYNY